MSSPDMHGDLSWCIDLHALMNVRTAACWMSLSALPFMDPLHAQGLQYLQALFRRLNDVVFVHRL